MARIIRAERLCVNPPGVLFLPAFSNAYAAGPTVVGALALNPVWRVSRGGQALVAVGRGDLLQLPRLSFAALARKAGSEAFAFGAGQGKRKVLQPIHVVLLPLHRASCTDLLFFHLSERVQGEHAWTCHG